MLHINEKKASDFAAAVSLISNTCTWYLFFTTRLPTKRGPCHGLRKTAAREGREPGGRGAGEGRHGAPAAATSRRSPTAQRTASSAGRWGWQPLGSLLKGSRRTPFDYSAGSQRPARKPHLLSIPNPLQGKWAALWEYLARVCLWKAAAADRVKSTVSTLSFFNKGRRLLTFRETFIKPFQDENK